MWVCGICAREWTNLWFLLVNIFMMISARFSCMFFFLFIIAQCLLERDGNWVCYFVRLPRIGWCFFYGQISFVNKIQWKFINSVCVLVLCDYACVGFCLTQPQNKCPFFFVLQVLEFDEWPFLFGLMRAFCGKLMTLWIKDY